MEVLSRKTGSLGKGHSIKKLEIVVISYRANALSRVLSRRRGDATADGRRQFSHMNVFAMDAAPI